MILAALPDSDVVDALGLVEPLLELLLGHAGVDPDLGVAGVFSVGAGVADVESRLQLSKSAHQGAGTAGLNVDAEAVGWSFGGDLDGHQ